MNTAVFPKTTETGRIPELFGSMVFNDHVMKERLPKETYKALKKPWSLASIWIPALQEWWPTP